MPGTRIGGQRAAATNKVKHGDDFYRKIGSLGGRAKTSKPKGFAANPKLARKAGRKGGKKSRRTGITTGGGQKKEYYYNGDHKVSNSKPTPKPEPIPEPKKRTFIDKILGR